MTTNQIERESDAISTAGWAALGVVMLLVAGIAGFAVLDSPVATDLLMGYDYDPSARTGLRVGAGFAVLAWFASFIASVLGMRRSTSGRVVLGTLVILALVAFGPLFLFAAFIAFTP